MADGFFANDPAAYLRELQMRLNGSAGGNYHAPASPETLQNMQRALPPMTPPTPPTGQQGFLDMFDMGAAAGGQLGMPPQQAPQPMPQPQGGGMLDGIQNFVMRNQGALAGLGAAIQSGRPVGYGVMQGQELDKKRKDEEDEKTREKTFADATSAFIKDPAFQAMVKADPKKASEVLRLFQAQQRENADNDYRNRTLALQEKQANGPQYMNVGGKLVRLDKSTGKAEAIYDGGGGTSELEQTVETRRKLATQMGLKEDDPQYRSYVMTGKMLREDAQPLSATDKKAIMEADEGVLAARGAIESLARAKELSKKAYEGFGASTRGYGMSLIGNEGGLATNELDNEVKTNALQSLKNIFGGSPTEGERAILLEIQGSSNLPDATRQKIYDKAIMLAQRSLQSKQQRANELRGGEYYKAGGGSAFGGSAAPAPQRPDPLGIR